MKGISAFALLFILTACKHPLAIEGEGDIVDLNGSDHGCTLEQFQAEDIACTENEVLGDYDVEYSAVPRDGWEFVGWTGPCAPRSVVPTCTLSTTAAAVEFWDAEYAEYPIPATIAHFERIPEGLPEDPGEAGMATLAGIDSDDDGVRDDIEIGIAAIGFDSGEETDSVMQLAEALQAAIESDSTSEDDVRSTGNQIAIAVNCASAVFGEDAATQILLMELLALNTEARSQAYAEFNAQSAGQQFGVTVSEEVACE